VENLHNEEEILYLTKDRSMQEYVESWGIYPPVLMNGREECAFNGESYYVSREKCVIPRQRTLLQLNGNTALI
jgi:hypothetical protein